MITVEQKHIIPIGCSCINQYQLDFYFGRKYPQPTRPLKRSSIFDWNVTTPESTIQFFQFVQAGNIKSIMCDRNNYTIEKGRLKNTAFECFYFWHENGAEITSENEEYFATFSKKVDHVLSNMLSPKEGELVHLLWSNVQPNLKNTVSTLPLTWDAFRLSNEKYQKIVSAAQRIFGDKVKCTCIARLEDIDETLTNLSNVVLLDLGRSSDFKGNQNLYDSIFDKIILS